jgi:hypothetical protein
MYLLAGLVLEVATGGAGGCTGILFAVKSLEFIEED